LLRVLWLRPSRARKSKVTTWWTVTDYRISPSLPIWGVFRK
jgi:hypothetical protein